MNAGNLIWRERQSESDFIASVWKCRTSEATSRTVLADPSISLSLVKENGSTKVVLTGPETKPRTKFLAPGYSCTTIRLEPGVLLRGFPVQNFVNRSLILPVESGSHFWLGGARLQFPDFNDAELFVGHLYRQGYLSHEIGSGQHSQTTPHLSPRSYSRMLKRTTGLSPYQLYQLQRLQRAFKLIKQGVSATTVAFDLGFVDQSHLTRVSKQFFGHTPKQLLCLPHIP